MSDPIPHDAHALPEDRRASLDHLERSHGYDRAALPRDRDALRLLHARIHGTPALGSTLDDDPALTPAAFAGRASAAMELLLLEMAALRAVDDSLSRSLASRWSTDLVTGYAS